MKTIGKERAWSVILVFQESVSTSSELVLRIPEYQIYFVDLFVLHGLSYFRFMFGNAFKMLTDGIFYLTLNNNGQISFFRH